MICSWGVMLRALDVKWRQQRTSQGIRVILISRFTLFSLSPPSPFPSHPNECKYTDTEPKNCSEKQKYSPLISSN